jgi:hypothetical protein
MSALTNQQATDIHNAAVAAGYPADALRINYYRIGGGGMTTLLSVPGDDNAPCYMRNMRGEWEHVSGPEINAAACAAQIEEYNEALEHAAIERRDDIH